MRDASRARAFAAPLALGFVLFIAVSAFPNTAKAYVPGDTIKHTNSYSYDTSVGGPNGAYSAGVAIYLNGSLCDWTSGGVYAPPNTPSSVSISCTVSSAGPVGTKYTFTDYLQVGGGGWVNKGDTVITVEAPTCTSFSYSGWGSCQPDGTQTRTVTSSAPAGCTGGSPVTSQTCTYTAPSCTYTYSDWGSCQSDGSQYRTVTSSSPSGCTGGSPSTSRVCPVASADVYLSIPSSMPVPYDSSVSLGVTSERASDCTLSGGGNTWSGIAGNTGVGNVGVGKLRSDTIFSLSCTADPNTVGTPSDSIDVDVAPQPPNLSFATNLSTSVPLPYSTGAYTLSGTITNSGGPYSGNNCWKIEYGTTVTKCWRSAGSGTTVNPVTEDTGRVDGVTYTYYLCANDGNGPCSGGKSLVVTKGTPSITWPDPASITYGTALSSAQLNATANIAGTFAYSPASGTVLSAGAKQKLSVTFTPTDTARYNNASTDVYLTVDKAGQTITFNALSDKTYGDAPFSLSASASSGLSVGFSSLTTNVCTVSGTTATIVNTGTCTIRASQGGNANYNAATSVDRSFAISVAAPGKPAVTPTTGSCDGNINLGYSGGSGGTTFKLHRNPDANGIAQWGQVASATTLAGLPASQSGLIPDSTYSYQVEAENSTARSYSDVAGIKSSVICFDYRIDTPTLVSTLTQGQYTDVFISTTLNSSANQGVTLTASGLGGGALPSGITYTVDPAGALNAGVTRVFRFTASNTAAVGTHTIQINGSPLNKTMTFSLPVAAPTITAVLRSYNTAGEPISSVDIGQTVIFQATVGGTATGAATYSGQSCGALGNIFNINGDSFSCTYTSTGSKTASITVTRQGVTSSPAIKNIEVTAPSNTLSIQTFLNGTEGNPGQTITFSDSSQNSGNFVTPYSIIQRSLIDITLSAPSSYSGDIFLGWSGCDSVGSQRRCFVKVGNGGTKQVAVNYGSSDFQPKLTAGTGSIQVDGSRYKEKAGVYVHNGENGYADNVYVVAAFTNVSSAKYDAENVALSFESSTDNGLNYTSVPPYLGGDAISVIPIGTSAKGWAGIGLSPNSYLVRACAEPSNAVAKTCTAGVRVVVEDPPPPPISPCAVTFANTTAGTGGDISTHVDITKTGCASDRWVEQFASESASVNNRTSGETNSVLDYGLGYWRPFAWSDSIGNDQDRHPTSFEAYANMANSGEVYKAGSGIGIWGTGSPASEVSFDNRSSYSDELKNKDGGFTIKMEGASTYRGLYGYRIASQFRARFVCYTEYHKVYDPTSNQFVTDSEWSYIYPFQGWLHVNPYINSCYPRNASGNYYEASCGDSQTPVFDQSFCPNGNSDKLKGEITNILPEPTLIARRHTLTVNSKLGTVFEPGVNITQSGTAVALDTKGVPISPTVAIAPLEGGDFGGTTVYTRTTERNFKVTLRADSTHTAKSGVFTGWSPVGPNGCAESSGLDCTISLVYEEPNGGASKTITANYIGTLSAPTLSTKTPSCEIGTGKLQLWWNAVPNATSYKLYRSTSPFTAASSGLIPLAYAQTTGVEVDADPNAPGTQSFTTPPTEAVSGAGANPFFDKDLDAGKQFYYQVQAIGNGGITSPKSATAADDASVGCPDLVVPTIEGITVTPGGRVTLDKPLRALEAKNFSAVVRNQGGSKTSLYATPFSNSFSILTRSLSSVPPALPNRTVTNLDPNVSTSPALLSDPWPSSQAGEYTLRVCADNGDVIPEGSGALEDNNCSYLDFTVGLPNLTASAPELSGTKIGNDFVANAPITVQGTLANNSTDSTANTAHGTFTNSYEFTISNPATTPASQIAWTMLSDAIKLLSQTPVAKGESGRVLQTLVWGGTEQSRIVAGTYYVRTCADRPVSGTYSAIPEKNENDNCSDRPLCVSCYTTITVSDKPTLSVQSTLNGVLSTGSDNARIKQMEGTPAPEALSGTTNYARTTDVAIVNAKLRAENYPISVGSTQSHGFLNWTGDCSPATGRDCTVNAAGGSKPTVTSNWESEPGLIFEQRKVKTGTQDAFTTTPLTITLGDKVEVRYKGERCGRYDATSVIGGASSNPASAWSGGMAPPSQTQKSISNSSYTSASLSDLTYQQYTLTLNCNNTGGTVTKSLVVNVELPATITCAPNPNPIFVDESSNWTVSGAPTGATYTWVGDDFNPTPKTGNPVSNLYGSALIGKKWAISTVKTSGGQTRDVACSPLTVNGRPDLTASVPVATGGKIAGTNDFIAATPVKLNASVLNSNESWSADTPNGDFDNAYFITMTNPSTGTPVWSKLSPVVKMVARTQLKKNETRALVELEWGGTAESRIAPGEYWIRVCADDGDTIREKNGREGNNCAETSATAGLKISNSPTLIVKNKLNGETLETEGINASISQLSGSPSGLGGITKYIKIPNAVIDATLRAAATYGSAGHALVNAQNTTSPWEGDCTTKTATDCKVDVPAGATKTVTVEYQSKPDLTFEFRKAGTTDAFTTNPLPLSFAQDGTAPAVEFRFRGERCGRYDAASNTGSATSNPRTSWGVVPPTSQQKTILNNTAQTTGDDFTLETVRDLSANAYTFTLSCSNSAGTVTKTLSLTTTVTEVNPTCAAAPADPKIDQSVRWTASGVPTGWDISWIGDDFSPSTKSGNPVTQAYATVGTKWATTTVTAPNGLSKKATCKVPVTGYPNLTANTPELTFGTQIIGTIKYVANTPIKLKASVNNNGTQATAATPNGTFSNTYEFTISDPNSPTFKSENWVIIEVDILLSPNNSPLAAGVADRLLQELEWGGNGKNTAGSFWFRACADKKYSTGTGSIVERDENDNCSGYLHVPFSDQPTLNVHSLLNGNPVTGNTNAPITALAGSKPTNLGGSTNYAKVSGEIIDGTLSAAPKYGGAKGDDFALVPVKDSNPSTSWFGDCTTKTATDCKVDVPAGATKTVTVEYQSKPDLTFEFRKAGTTDAFTTNPLPLSFAQDGTAPAVEFRFRGERCNTYYSLSATGSAGSSPATSWSGGLASTQKTILNNLASTAGDDFTAETVSNLTGASYTFTLSCSNTAGSVSKTLTLSVGFGDPGTGPNPVCDASPSAPKIDQLVTWTTRNIPSGWGVSWIGDDFSPSTKSGNPVTQAYATVGTKWATSTVTAPGGQKKDVACKVPVTGYPDLTANAPAVTVGSVLVGTSAYLSDTPIKLKGSVSNNSSKATAATPNGTFYNTYEFTASDPPTAASVWNVLEVDVLVYPDNAPIAVGATRTLQEASWGGNRTVMPGVYYVRTCADKKFDTGAGSITERDENNNCSGYTRVEWSDKPSLTVEHKLDGSLVTTEDVNVDITELAGGTPSGLGGRTKYRRSPDSVIDAVLRAPGRYGGASGSEYALVKLSGKTTPWQGCTSTSGTNNADCRVVVPASGTKLVTVEYQSKPDISFDMRRSGTTIAFSAADLTVSYGQGVELRFRGERCKAYYEVADDDGAAGSNPATSWSSNAATGAKRILNNTSATSGDDFTVESVLNLTNPAYTFTLSCTNSADTATKALKVSVELPSMSCAPDPNPIVIDNSSRWTVTDAPGGSTYVWSGSDGLSGTTGTTNSITKNYNTIGAKTASVTVSAPGGLKSTVICSPLTVNGLPDLTVNAPQGVGTKIESDFVANLPITLRGSVNNNVPTATAATPNGTFGSTIEITMTDPASGKAVWSTLKTGVLPSPDTSPLSIGAINRALQDVTWGGDKSIYSGTYWIQLCTNNPSHPSAFMEKRSDNNCAISRFTVTAKPELIVESKVNGLRVDGPLISQISGTPAPNELLGNTRYTKLTNASIDAVLRAPNEFSAPAPYGTVKLVRVKDSSPATPWENCTGVTGDADCRVTVGGGQSKTLYVNYQSKPDLTFEHRKAGTATSYQTTPLSLIYGEKAEVRFAGARCDAYYAASGPGTATSNPPSTWITRPTKTVFNTGDSTEVVGNSVSAGLTSQVYTLTLSCSNSAGTTEKTLIINVGLPPMSCAPDPNPIIIDTASKWTVSGAPSGSTFSWTGLDGLSGTTGTTNFITKTYSATGVKTASVAVTAPGGQIGTVNCSPLTVNGLPDLTANAPTVDGSKIAGTTDFISATPIKILGTINNNVTTATAATPGFDFTSVHQFTIRDPVLHAAGNTDSDTDWVTLLPGVKMYTPRVIDRGESNRALQEFIWGGDNSIAAGDYFVRTCADKPNPGTVTEKVETNNCGGWTKLRVSNRPNVTVQSRVNGDLVGGAAIAQSAGSPAGLGDTTPYTKTPDSTVDATLRAANSFTAPSPYGFAALVNIPGALHPWEGCTQNIGTAECKVNVGAGGQRVLTAYYQTAPNLTFEIRKGSTGSFSASDLSVTYGDDVQLRFRGDRCATYYAASATGSAVSSPATSWSGGASSAQKTIQNNLSSTPGDDYTMETVSNLTNATYTFTLSCQNSAGTAAKSVKVNVGIAEIPITCAPDPNPVFIDNKVAWTVKDAPGGSNFTWTGTDALSGSGAATSIEKTYTTTGTKEATVVVNAPGGQTRSVACTNLTVNGRPDLTANPPTATGEQIAGTSEFIAATPVRLKGAVNNNVITATAPTDDGIFSNTYEYTITDPMDPRSIADPSRVTWNILRVDIKPLQPQRLEIGSAGRELQEGIWGGDNSIAAGDYWVRTCADKFWETGLGTITEKNENNNCSETYLKVTVVTKPTLVVKTVLDGAALGNISVTGSQTGTGGTTSLGATPSGSYTVVKTEKIDTTLTAPPDAPNAKFTSWECADGTKNDTNRTCSVSVSGNGIKTVTARYSSVAGPSDLSLAQRKAGTSGQFLPNALTLVLGESTELQWLSPSGRCANPATVSGDWSSPATRALDKTARTETSMPSVVRTHTFTIECAITINGVRTAYTRSVTVNITAPDLTANAPSAEGSKVGNSFVAGTPITLKASVNNSGAGATASAPGTFTSTYEFTLTDPNLQGANPTWTSFDPAVPLSPDTSALAAGTVSRTLRDLIWGEDGSTSVGTYWIHTCADQPDPGAVPEKDEANNCSSATAVTIVASADLLISKDPAPIQGGTLYHDNVYTFSGDIKNGGSLAANPAFKNRFQVKKSSESGGGTDTIPNVQASNLSTLASGTSAPVNSGNWTAIAGRHVLSLCADLPDNAVFEWDETNNCSQESVTVSIYPTIPVVNAVELSSASNCGGKISLNYSGGEGATEFSLYRKKGGDTLPYDLIETRNEAGAVIINLRSIDDGLDPGATYYYMVKAIGPDDLSSESARPKRARATDACTGNKPDLVAVSVAVNGTTEVGSSLTFTGIVKNNGNVDVGSGATFENKFTLTKDGAEVDSFSLRPITGLLRGDANAKSVTTAESWTAEAGTYRLEFCADKGAGGAGVVDELDDPNGTNNCTSTDFTVGAGTSSTLDVTLSAAPNGQVVPLSDVSLTANITGSATGAVTYMFDYTNDGTDEVVKTISTPTSGDTSYSTAGSERRSYTTAGKYTARVDVTRGGESDFTTAIINVRPNLTLATGPGCKSITASWGNVNSVSTYTLWRSPTGGDGTYTPLGTFGSGTLSYVDSAVNAGATYYYQFQATLTDGSSLYSDVKSQLSSGACGQTRSLGVTITAGSGRVKTDTLEINCGTAPGQTLCEASYPYSTIVNLTAEPATGATFAGWGGECASAGTNLTCDITMNANADVTAGFNASVGSAPSISSCFASPNPATVGSAVTWTMYGSGGSGTYTGYTWTSASDAPLGDAPYTSGQAVTINEGYSSSGTKGAVATVTDSNGRSSSATPCTNLTVNPVPGFNYSLVTESPVYIALSTTKTSTATKTLISGTTQNVTLQVASITSPSGGTVTGSGSTLTIGSGNSRFTITIDSNNPSNPTSASDIESRTRSQAPLGTYTVVLRGVSSGIADKTATFYVDVSTTGQGGDTSQPVFEEF